MVLFSLKVYYLSDLKTNQVMQIFVEADGAGCFFLFLDFSISGFFQIDLDQN